MSTVRGRGRNLEIAVDRALPAAGEELRAHFLERPDFYRGSHAVANLGDLEPAAARSRRSATCSPNSASRSTASRASNPRPRRLAELELAYLGSAPVDEVSALPRSRAARAIELSPEGPVARRRLRRRAGRPRQRRLDPATAAGRRRPASRPPASPFRPRRVDAPAGVSTLYHRGTVRGGQALHNMSATSSSSATSTRVPNWWPAATSSSFGALRGVAHAGAQGDRTARVYRNRIRADATAHRDVHRRRRSQKSRRAARKQAAIEDDRIADRSARSSTHVIREGARMSARRIVITSGKGGVGKTTTTVNVGAALAKRGHRVVLVDADIGLRNLDLVLGLEKRIVFDMVEVVEGRCQLRQALIKDKRFEIACDSARRANARQNCRQRRAVRQGHRRARGDVPTT